MNYIFELDQILNSICSFYRIEKEELVSENRKAYLVEARQMFFYLCEEFSEQPYTKIGKFIERDHSTVIYSISKIRMLKDVYPKLKTKIEEITERLFQDHSLIPEHIDLLQLTENYTKSFI